MNKHVATVIVVVAIVAAGLVYMYQAASSPSTISSAVLGGPLTAFSAKLGTLTPSANGLNYTQGVCNKSTGGLMWPSVWRLSVDGTGRVVNLEYHDCLSGAPVAHIEDNMPPDTQGTSPKSNMLAGVEGAAQLQWCGVSVANDGQITITHFPDGWGLNVGPPC